MRKIPQERHLWYQWYIGAYVAALGGLDAAVFAEGIGENDAWLRMPCGSRLEALGTSIDEHK